MSAPVTADDFGASLRVELNRWHPQGNDAEKEQRRLLARWKRTICSRVGPDATCRLIALVLAAHLTSSQQSAPSQGRLATESGLSLRATGEAIRRLVAQRWLIQITTKLPGRGARGIGFRYVVNMPQRVLKVRGSTAPGAYHKTIGQTAKSPFRDVETLDSGPKSLKNGIVRDVVIDGGAPC
jgi:hypothetical protein